MALENETAATLDVVAKKLDELSKAVSEKKSKDSWDIAGVVSQIVSAVFLGAVGLWWNQHTQVQLAKLSASTQAQLADLAQKTSNESLEDGRRDRLLKYLEEVADAHGDDEKRRLLIASSELAIPDQADVVAKYYAAIDPTDQVRLAAIEVLGEQRDRNALYSIIQTGRLPDTDAAKKALGEHDQEVRLRMSDIDDDGKAFVNGVEVARTSRDSGWVDVTQYAHGGKNDILFRLFNGPAGGYGGRFQVLAGGNIYDSGSIAKNQCPCNAEAMDISLSILRDQKNKITGLSAANVVFLPIP
jgi:hypothetical protein